MKRVRPSTHNYPDGNNKAYLQPRQGAEGRKQEALNPSLNEIEQEVLHAGRQGGKEADRTYIIIATVTQSTA